MSFQREKQTKMLLRLIGPNEYKRFLKLEPGWEKTLDGYVYSVERDSKGNIHYYTDKKGFGEGILDSVEAINNTRKKWKKTPFLYGSTLNRFFTSIGKTSTIPINNFYLYEVEPSSVPKSLLKEIETVYAEPTFGNTLKPKTREHFEQIFLKLD
jgi:hypothetical protein